MSKLPFIVVDTNVLISAALLPQSRSAQVLALVLKHFVIAQNAATWAELETRISRAKFDRYFGEQGRQKYLIQLAKSIERFRAVAGEVISVDSSDDKFVSLAMDAGAKIIISGDVDLKQIVQHKGVQIMSPTQFFEHMRGVYR